MKIRTLALGEYGSPATRFCLYLFPTPLTPPLLSPSHINNDKQQLPAMIQGNKDMDCCFLCLDDLEALFFNDNHNDAKHALSKAYYEHPSWFCADQTTGKPFITTRAVAHIAHQLSMDTLVDLCTMTESDIFHGNADHLLRRVVDLRPISITAVDQELVPTRLLDGAARFRVQGNTTTLCSPVIRLSPPSEQQHVSTPLTTSTRFDPCRDDVAASGSGYRRLSFMPHKDASKNSSNQHEQQLPLPKPSSLLLKRSAHHHHNKAPANLTIMTPAYGAGDPASIHSAPLHPRGHKQNPVNPLQSAKQPRLNKVIKRAPPATAAPWSKHKPTSTLATTATTARPQTEFPSPPIVPSQQRYPPPPTATTSGLKTATLVPKTPAVAVQPVSRKQQFLQPFEMLYDNIEQTKSLKATLDDQIRHSSTLIHTLQSSSTMVENLTRKYVRESVHQQIQDYVNRIERLESRITTRRQRTCSGSPTPSQQGDLKHLLSDLVNRLDRLESKMDTRQ
ncbi:hypothetical protein K492DRAFT_206521 [Lichtheimia hyalospora FSU 10163]|nr:hypothetical protein K492DRAFT_206521 [Lichtheimia hyalospora FSU 10163]